MNFTLLSKYIVKIYWITLNLSIEIIAIIFLKASFFVLFLLFVKWYFSLISMQSKTLILD